MKRKAILPLAACFILGAQAAFAHPHIFAEARLEVVASDDGKVQELRNVWRFDEMFSSSVLLDFDANSDLKLDEKELAEVGNVVLESLADYSYYTFITHGGKSIAVSKPEAIHVTFEDNQIMMMFSVKTAEPLQLKGKSSFGVWDPTMYTAIDFANDTDIATVGKGFSACERKVIRPDADEVLAQNQSSLTDAFFNDPAGTDMSKLFATRLEVTCQ